MPPMSEGIMVILSSPSGAGKTTLVKLLSERKIFLPQYHIPQEHLDQMRQMEKTIILLATKSLQK